MCLLAPRWRAAPHPPPTSRWRSSQFSTSNLPHRYPILASDISNPQASIHAKSSLCVCVCVCVSLQGAALVAVAFCCEEDDTSAYITIYDLLKKSAKGRKANAVVSPTDRTHRIHRSCCCGPCASIHPSIRSRIRCRARPSCTLVLQMGASK